MITWLGLFFAAATAAQAADQATDPLADALFQICPALLAGTLSENDGAKLGALGFQLIKTRDGRMYLGSIKQFTVLIDVPLPPARPTTTCSVNLLRRSASERHDRLLGTLKANDLEVTELPSPIGGGLINAKRPGSGKLVTTSQVFDDSILTLVPGA